MNNLAVKNINAMAGTLPPLPPKPPGSPPPAPRPPPPPPEPVPSPGDDGEIPGAPKRRET